MSCNLKPTLSRFANIFEKVHFGFALGVEGQGSGVDNS